MKPGWQSWLPVDIVRSEYSYPRTGNMLFTELPGENEWKHVGSPSGHMIWSLSWLPIWSCDRELLETAQSVCHMWSCWALRPSLPADARYSVKKRLSFWADIFDHYLQYIHSDISLLVLFNGWFPFSLKFDQTRSVWEQETLCGIWHSLDFIYIMLYCLQYVVFTLCYVFTLRYDVTLRCLTCPGTGDATLEIK